MLTQEEDHQIYLNGLMTRNMTSESHYNIAFFKEEMAIFEEWYIKLYGPSEITIPEKHKDLYQKTVVLRKNEEALEGLEDEDEPIV